MIYLPIKASFVQDRLIDWHRIRVIGKIEFPFQLRIIITLLSIKFKAVRGHLVLFSANSTAQFYFQSESMLSDISNRFRIALHNKMLFEGILD